MDKPKAIRDRFHRNPQFRQLGPSFFPHASEAVRTPDTKPCRDERPQVRPFGDLRLPRRVVMARVCCHAQQDRPTAPLRRLEHGRELVRVARHHAVVVVRRQQQRRRITGSLVDVMKRRVSEQIAEVGGTI